MHRLFITLAATGAVLVGLHAATVLQSEATALAQDEEQARQTLFVKIGRPG